jgi:hypothetical protein
VDIKVHVNSYKKGGKYTKTSFKFTAWSRA